MMMTRLRFVAALAVAMPAVVVAAAPAPGVVAPVAAPMGWRDMLRDYGVLRDAGVDCSKAFPGCDPEVARLGEAFARTAYAADPVLGRANFRRMVGKLRLAHPSYAWRQAFVTPNKSPWPGYAGPVDEDDGMAHFLFNTGTLPMGMFSHPIAGVVMGHDVSRARVKPIAQCAARVIRRERADLARVEAEMAVRDALVAAVRAAFDVENPSARMSDEEARCLAACLPYMA